MCLKIVIWDLYPERIAQIDKNLHVALRQLGIKGLVTCNSEPPSLMRAKIYHRVPALEIEGNFWMCTSSTPDVAACTQLLRKFQNTTVKQYKSHSLENIK